MTVATAGAQDGPDHGGHVELTAVHAERRDGGRGEHQDGGHREPQRRQLQVQQHQRKHQPHEVRRQHDQGAPTGRQDQQPGQRDGVPCCPPRQHQSQYVPTEQAPSADHGGDGVVLVGDAATGADQQQDNEQHVLGAPEQGERSRWVNGCLAHRLATLARTEPTWIGLQLSMDIRRTSFDSESPIDGPMPRRVPTTSMEECS